MNRWFTRTQRGKRPDARWIIFSKAFWLLALAPAEETRLVLPHVPGPRQNWSILSPDDLLMHECAVLFPDGFEKGLPATGMPTIPCGIFRNCVLQCDPNKGIVKSVAFFGAIYILIFIAP